MDLRALAYLLLVFFAVLVFAGCASTTDPQISFAPPTYVEEIPAKEEEELFGNVGSLFGQGDNPLFSDRKAMKVNDLLTVVINESTTSSSTGSNALNKANNKALGSPALTSTNRDGIAKELLVDPLNQIGNFGLNMASSSDFTGTGTKSSQESFTTTITARVIKIMQNGNYFIEGGREILKNGEKQKIRVSGVVRPYDIDQTNTINSKYIADARILYDTEGDIRRNTEQGWGGKIIDSVWPF